MNYFFYLTFIQKSLIKGWILVCETVKYILNMFNSELRRHKHIVQFDLLPVVQY